MTIALSQYAKIKDRYCVGYFGKSNEYLVQLLMLRPNIEKAYPGVKVYIACHTDAFQFLSGHERIMTYEELKENERSFAYILNLKCNLMDHPIEALLEESGIPLRIKVPEAKETNNKCIIMPHGIIPTHSMSDAQIEECKRRAEKKKFIPEVSNNFANAGWVIGVENEYFFAAAAHGLKTSLVPTGLGTNLYRKMLERAEVLDLGV
jgi:hypothetical protein